MRLGHFDPPGPMQQLPLKDVCADETQAVASEGTAQSATLLKNVGGTLPLAPSQTVAVIGPNAMLSRGDASYYGPGDVCDGKFWTLVDAVAGHATSKPLYAAGVPSILSNDTSKIAAAAALGATADAVVVAIGTDLSWAHEEHDADPVHGITLTPAQAALVEQVAKAAKAPITVTMLTATPLDISAILANPKVGAVLHLGQPAVAIRGAGDVLYGIRSPAGRTIQTVYPSAYATQVSIYDFNMRPGPSAFPAPGCTQRPASVCPNGTNPGRTYKFYTGKAIVPFGFGLSYTKFSYTLVRVPSGVTSLAPLRRALAADAGRSFLQRGAANAAGGEEKVGEEKAGASAPLVTYVVNVTNAGSMAADDVVLGFLTPPNAGKGGTPLKSLFGFERVHVLPGQTVSVFLYPRLADFAQVATDGERVVHAGEYVASFGVREAAAHGMGFASHAFSVA